jgi:hypothetical protein
MREEVGFRSKLVDGRFDLAVEVVEGRIRDAGIIYDVTGDDLEREKLVNNRSVR